MDKKREVNLIRPITRDMIRENIKADLSESCSKETARLKRQKRVDEILRTMSQYASKQEIEKVRRIAMSMSDEEFEQIEKRAKEILDGLTL